MRSPSSSSAAVRTRSWSPRDRGRSSGCSTRRRVQPLSDTRLAVTFKGDGSQARVIFEAASIRNPFVHQEVTRFHCS